MNGETKSKILLILVVGLAALACGTIVSAFVHIDLPHENLLEDIEDIENDTILSINDTNITKNTTQTKTTTKKTTKKYKKSNASSSGNNVTDTSSSGNSQSSSSSGSTESSSTHSGSNGKPTTISTES